MLDPLLKLCKAIMGPFGITLLDSLTYHFKAPRKTFSEQKKEHRWAPLDTQKVGVPVRAPLWSSRGEENSTAYELPVLCGGGGKQGGRDFILPKNNRRGEAETKQTCISKLKLFYIGIWKSSSVSEQSNCAQDFFFLKSHLKKSVLATGLSPDVCTCTHWGTTINWLYPQRTDLYTKQSEEIRLWHHRSLFMFWRRHKDGTSPWPAPSFLYV